MLCIDERGGRDIALDQRHDLSVDALLDNEIENRKVKIEDLGGGDISGLTVGPIA